MEVGLHIEAEFGHCEMQAHACSKVTWEVATLQVWCENVEKQVLSALLYVIFYMFAQAEGNEAVGLEFDTWAFRVLLHLRI